MSNQNEGASSANGTVATRKEIAGNYNRLLILAYPRSNYEVDMAKVDYSDINLQSMLLMSFGMNADLNRAELAYSAVKARMNYAALNDYASTVLSHNNPSQHTNGTLALNVKMKGGEKIGEPIYCVLGTEASFVANHESDSVMSDFYALSAMNLKIDGLQMLNLSFKLSDGTLKKISTEDIMKKAYIYTRYGSPIFPLMPDQSINQDALGIFKQYVRHVKEVKKNAFKDLAIQCDVMKHTSVENIKSICFVVDQPYVTSGTPIEIQRCLYTFALTKLDGFCQELQSHDDIIVDDL